MKSFRALQEVGGRILDLWVNWAEDFVRQLM